MPGTTGLTAYLPKFLLSRFRRNSPCFILRVPFDVHVNEIFIYLHVEDIICLRRVRYSIYLLRYIDMKYISGEQGFFSSNTRACNMETLLATYQHSSPTSPSNIQVYTRCYGL